MANERQRGNTIVVDAGGAPGGTGLYDRLKFEAIVKGELQMNVQAHNIGGPELALGLDELVRLHQELKVPFVSANLRDASGRQPFDPCQIVPMGGRRIAFVGVLAPRYAVSGCRIDEPREAILQTLRQRKGQYDSAIVLAYLLEAELRELAAALPEVDAIVGGPTGQSIAPVRLGPLLLASATNKGKFVVRLKVPVAKGSWSGESIELNEKFSDDPVQQQVLADFRKHLAKRDLTASESGLAADFGRDLPSDYKLAGSQACEKCHAMDHDHWRMLSHARAWETLSTHQAQMDSYCQQCHTTGFGLPGGFQSAKQTGDRLSVGCESCHGPSQAHVQQTSMKTPFAAKDQCVRCHDHENSPKFDFTTYWARIEHGGKSKARADSPAVRTNAK